MLLRQQLRDVTSSFPQKPCGIGEHLGAPQRRRLAPLGKSTRSGSQRHIQIGRTRQRDPADLLFRAGVEHRHALTGDCLAPLSVDQQPDIGVSNSFVMVLHLTTFCLRKRGWR